MALRFPFVLAGSGNARRLKNAALFCGLTVLQACGPASAPTGIDDPNEARNREIHNFNKGLDAGLIKPAADVYGAVLPGPVKTGVANFVENLDAPGDVLNNLAQGRVHFAAQNTLRFAVNTVFGIGGLFDVADAIGLPGRPTDFGETLHVWGAPEGSYVELPVIGPSTNRDAAGTIVDFALNPLRLVLDPSERNWVTGAKVAATLGYRDQYSASVDETLYGSADSYAKARLVYLQNRRFVLGQTTADAEFIDPYEDANAK